MGGTMTYASFANWSTSETTACTSCHGGPGTYAAINLSNAHKKHAGSDRYNFACSECHNDTVSTGNSPVTSYTKHVNSVKDVKFDGTNPSGAYTSPNCTSLACHGNGTGSTGSAAWSATLDCKGCHNYTVASGSPMATGKHAQHINQGNLGVFGCSDCHTRTVQSDNATVEYGLGKHVDGTKTVALNFNSYTGFYTATFTCRNTYCHSSGQATPAYRTTTAWTAGTALDCDGCHGSEGTSYAAGAPEYANLSTASRNSFNGHYVPGHVSAVTDCIKCHNTTVDAAGAVKAGSVHLDGARNVSFALGGTYSDKRCSNTDVGCHGTTTMRWGGTGSCIDCHKTTGVETDDYVYGNATKATIGFYEWTSVGHGKTGTYRYTGRTGANKVCEDCHSAAVAHNTPTNPFRLTNADTDALCAGCHGGSIGNHDFAHVAQGTWSWTPKCVDCHDPHGDKGGVTSTEYNGAMVQSNVSYTVSNAYGVPGTTEPVDFPANFTRAKGLNMFNWSSFVVTTGQSNKGVCRVCHTDAGTNYFTRTAYSTHRSDQGSCASCHIHSEGFKPSCDSCHGYPPNIADGHTDNAGAVGAHDKHVTGVGLSCYDCHKGNTHNQTGVTAPYTAAVTPAFVNMSVTSTYSLDGMKPEYNGTPGSWTPYKTCGTTACHYSLSPSWDCQ
jgi:predicted CxxxxCH...CXXCH cytochrome family protein